MPWPKTDREILNRINCITVILVMLGGVSSRCAEKSTAELLYQQLHQEHKRGAVVEWLEQLGYGAESRRIA